MEQFEEWFNKKFELNQNSVEMMLLKPHLKEAWEKGVNLGVVQTAKLTPILSIETLKEMHQKTFKKIGEFLRSPKPPSDEALAYFFEKDVYRIMGKITDAHKIVHEAQIQ